MTVYPAAIISLLVWAGLLLWHEPSRLKARLFCIIASGQWILLSGLRHISIGADTYAYKVAFFDYALTASWTDVFRRLWGTYFGQLTLKDPGFLVVVKALQYVSHDYQVFLVLIAIIFTVPLGIFIYRSSSDPFLSFLIYSCLFASFFAITGIRQTIATALVLLIGYKFIRERRILPFLLLSVVAFAIHKSSIVFLPFYFLDTLRVTGRRALAMLAATPVVYLSRMPIMSFVGSLTGYEEYTQQYAGAGTWMFSAMLALVVMVALWRAPAMLEHQPHSGSWINALLVALVLTPLTYVDPSAMRVVQYYSFFLVLLVPEIVRSFPGKRERMLIHYLAAAVLVLLFFRTNPQYLFFWQA